MTNTLDELANATVASFTVGFARHPPVHDAGNCFGSGILARYQNVAGILTCAHVVEAAHRQNSIAIIPNSVPGRGIAQRASGVVRTEDRNSKATSLHVPLRCQASVAVG